MNRLEYLERLCMEELEHDALLKETAIEYAKSMPNLLMAARAAVTEYEKWEERVRYLGEQADHQTAFLRANMTTRTGRRRVERNRDITIASLGIAAERRDELKGAVSNLLVECVGRPIELMYDDVQISQEENDE